MSCSKLTSHAAVVCSLDFTTMSVNKLKKPSAISATMALASSTYSTPAIYLNASVQNREYATTTASDMQPMTAREQYWATRALRAEALLAAQESHKKEVKTLEHVQEMKLQVCHCSWKWPVRQPRIYVRLLARIGRTYERAQREAGIAGKIPGLFCIEFWIFFVRLTFVIDGSRHFSCSPDSRYHLSCNPLRSPLNANSTQATGKMVVSHWSVALYNPNFVAIHFCCECFVYRMVFNEWPLHIRRSNTRRPSLGAK